MKKRRVKSRPRVHCIGLGDESTKIEALSGHCSAQEHRPRLDEKDNVPWSEVDIVVAKEIDVRVSGDAHWLLYGARNVPVCQQNATETEIFTDQQFSCFEQAAETLVRTADDRNTVMPGIPLQHIDDAVPLISTTDGPVAAIFNGNLARDGSFGFGDPQLDWFPLKQSGEVERWILSIPEIADLEQWFRAFLEFLHENDPKAVPNQLPKVGDPLTWATSSELAIHRKIEELEKRRDQVENDLAKAKGDLQSEEAVGDRRERRLLYSEGDELVGSVLETLCLFGLNVIDIDKQGEEDQTSEASPKVEDLHIGYPDWGEWVALVEVKAYKKGPRENDLTQLNKHVKRYIENSGKQPEVALMVVNPFRRNDPGARPNSNDHQLCQSAKLLDIAVLKTTDLYLLRRAFENELISAEFCRDFFKNCEPGLLEYSPTLGESEEVAHED